MQLRRRPHAQTESLSNVGAVDDGALDEARIESMRHLEQELEHERRKADPQARAEAGRPRADERRDGRACSYRWSPHP